MRAVRDPIHAPLKPFKLIAFFTAKNSDILRALCKGAVLLFLIATISLLLLTIFAAHTWWFRLSECENDPSQKIAGACETRDYSPDESPTNISHVIFGIGGSINTWKDRKHYSELWWQPNLTRGYVWLEERPEPIYTWPDTSPPYRVSEGWKRFRSSSSQSAVRIARIVVETFRLGLPNVRWFVMGDDDTVFFTDNLVSVLGRYDHSRMYYIGGNSESVEQNVMHSYDMAYGGGGFAVSYPLAAELVRVFDGCLEKYHYVYGSDERVRGCVSEIGVPLTIERGFHQLDIQGDPYGLLAAHPVTPLVSLHHLDNVQTIFPNQTRLESLKVLTEAYRVDPARTLQQCFCSYRTWKRKWSVSISWGYTVQTYHSLLTTNYLETPLQTFQTWRTTSDGPFTFNTRPVSSNPCEEPVIYYLDWVQEVGKGETLTSYKRLVQPKRRCHKADHRLSVERIHVSALKMNPEEWKQAPRRHCCQIVSLEHGRMKVRIRNCKPGESVIS